MWVTVSFGVVRAIIVTEDQVSVCTSVRATADGAAGIGEGTAIGTEETAAAEDEVATDHLSVT